MTIQKKIVLSNLIMVFVPILLAFVFVLLWIQTAGQKYWKPLEEMYEDRNEMCIRDRDVSVRQTKSGNWLLYAVGSAVFASLTSILGKVGISGVESNLGTAIRTGVVLVMAWVMVFATGKQHMLREIPKGELGFICLSEMCIRDSCNND